MPVAVFASCQDYDAAVPPIRAPSRMICGLMGVDSSTAEAGTEAGETAGRSRRRWLAVVIGLAVLVTVVAGSAWVMSSFLVKPGHHRVRQDTDVIAVHDKTVVLQRTDASTRPGVYGLVWPRGHAVVGPVVAETDSTVTRELRSLEGRLATTDKVGIDLKVWESDPKTALGIPFRNVGVPGPLGSMPAWFVPASGRTWAIIVHGINGDRDVGLRIVPTVREAGYPSLLIRLRNDRGAPRSPDGQIHLGMTEWQDLDAAAAYALSHGARDLVLVGYSMGATIVSRFMRMSQHASSVRGLVFDSALLDWRGAISHVASAIPHPLHGTARPVGCLGSDRYRLGRVGHAESRRQAARSDPRLPRPGRFPGASVTKRSTREEDPAPCHLRPRRWCRPSRELEREPVRLRTTACAVSPGFLTVGAVTSARTATQMVRSLLV